MHLLGEGLLGALDKTHLKSIRARWCVFDTSLH